MFSSGVTKILLTCKRAGSGLSDHFFFLNYHEFSCSSEHKIYQQTCFVKEYFGACSMVVLNKLLGVNSECFSLTIYVETISKTSLSGREKSEAVTSLVQFEQLSKTQLSL